MKDLKPRSGKPPMWLLPYKPLRAIVSALHDGATKYEPNGYREYTEDWKEVYSSALLRHVMQYMDPDCSDYDDDEGGSGLHHLAHAGANVVILLYHAGVDYVASRNVDKDQRKPEPAPKNYALEAQKLVGRPKRGVSGRLQAKVDWAERATGIAFEVWRQDLPDVCPRGLRELYLEAMEVATPTLE